MPLTMPTNDVPIFIETLPRPSVPLVRCIYMAIENSDPGPEWQIIINDQTMPFLMLGMTGIIQQPFGTSRFDSYNVIEEFFAKIEDEINLLLVFEDLWLPPFLFPDKVQLGTVYRIRLDLFRFAYRFRGGGMTTEAFEHISRDLTEAIAESKRETFAFASWIAEQVTMADHNQKNPDLGMRLKSREEG